jgi:glycosyltransferase involved in cell wall biosynthesis
VKSPFSSIFWHFSPQSRLFSHMARVILSVINDLSGDQRMHRIGSSLQEMGHEVLLLGRKLPDSRPLGERPYACHRMKLLFSRGKFFYLEYNLRLFLFLLFQPRGIWVANDLDTLLGTFLACRLRGSELVYDSHEYFTEVPELIHRPGTRTIWLRLERWLFPKLKKTYTVNASIAEIYQQKYGVEVGVIRNLPFRRTAAEAQAPEKILIYQGALNVGRGIELMIAAMQFLPGYQLWIVGRGDVEEKLRAQAAASAWAERVVFHGFMPLEQLAPLTARASLGFSLEEDLGANYHYASPNKVYDYIQAGVPVLVSDLPEMRRVAVDHGVGEVLAKEERDPKDLAKRVRNLVESETKYATYQANCRKAAEVLNWEAERQKLTTYY